jgi:hypothetical protein
MELVEVEAVVEHQPLPLIHLVITHQVVEKAAQV